MMHGFSNAKSKVKKLLSFELNWIKFNLSDYFLLLLLICSTIYDESQRNAFWISRRKHPYISLQIFLKITDKCIVIMRVLAVVLDKINDVDAISKFSIVRFQ
jgi:hypothetical protein